MIYFFFPVEVTVEWNIWLHNRIHSIILPHANILDLNNNKNAVKFFLTSSLVSPTIKRVKCEVGWGPEISAAGLKTSAQIQVTYISVALQCFLFWQPTLEKLCPYPMYGRRLFLPRNTLILSSHWKDSLNTECTLGNCWKIVAPLSFSIQEYPREICCNSSF